MMTPPLHIARATLAQSSTLTLRVTPTLRDVAWLVARLRTQAHDGTRKPGADFGPAGNLRADYNGVLGELGVILALEQSGLQPTGYHLLSDLPPVGPDFRLGNTHFDIKTVPPGNRYLCINERQRTDPLHRVDFVLPVVVQREDNIAVYRPISASDVASWPLRQGHSGYRSIEVANLRPLYCLTDLMP